MQEKDITNLLQEFSDRLPHFPDGRIDYHSSDKALVLTCFVEYAGKILLLKRSDQVGTYRGLWNSVAGYIDEAVPLEDKIREELREELGLGKDAIASLRVGKMYDFFDPGIGKTWFIVPCLATLAAEPHLQLDWEHTEYRWIGPEELGSFPVVPGLERSLQAVWKKA